MNNIDLYIQELETSKVEIKEAIIAKGVTPTGGLSSYAAAINDIEGATIETDDLGVLINENGSYYYTPEGDGFTSVAVTVDVIPPPVITQEKDVTITSNGETIVTPDSGFDGLNKVNISVEVPTSGGGKPKIYNGFRFSGNKSYGSVNAFRQIDFSQYDWSCVYDTGYFFGDFCKSLSGDDGWVDADFENFRQYYNGKMLNCSNLFSTSDSSWPPLIELPNFGNMTNGCFDMSCMCFQQNKMTSADNIANWNTSSVINMYRMFFDCNSLTSIPHFDTSKVTNMEEMFYNCYGLTSIPQFDTSKVTNMRFAFYNCRGLTSIPQFDTSKVTAMNGMFQRCSNLTSIPQFDMSNVTSLSSMFYDCPNLTELPDFNTKSMKTWSNWLPAKLQKVGVIDCDSTTNVSSMLTASSVLTEIGGFRNLGMQSSVSNTSGNTFLYNVPNLTHESLINIFDLLYDRASAGYSVLTLKLAAAQMSKLSDDDKAIAINKGWSLSS